jgi:arylsulfatase
MPWDPKSYWTYDKKWAHACNTPHRLYKRNQHEGGIATPLIAHWPAGIRRPGRITHQVGHLVDVLPTCLELAGVAYPKTHRGQPVGPTRGKSLTPIFAGDVREPHKELFFVFGNGTHRALRTGDWKIVSHSQGPWELYNMREDRTELRNLAARDPARLKAMAGRWEELAEEVGVAKKGRGSKRKESRK